MRRREFITLLGGAVLMLPVATLAKDDTRLRKLGILMNLEAYDEQGLSQIKVFAKELQKYGWVEGDNLHTENALGRR